MNDDKQLNDASATLDPVDAPQSSTNRSNDRAYTQRQPDEIDNSDDDFYADETSDDDLYAENISLDKETRPKTFHSKHFIDSETQAAEDKEKSSTHEPEIKTKLSHAETSGVAISAVMLAYSIAEADKPLFFLSTALLTFLLRPLIGALFGKHNRAVQNALHSFSVVLFIGTLLFLFM